MVGTLRGTRFSDACSTKGVATCETVGGSAAATTSLSPVDTVGVCRLMSRLLILPHGTIAVVTGDMAVSTRQLRMKTNGFGA